MTAAQPRQRPDGLPSSVCVRVTRACNARCGFCLAPPTGHGVTFESIVRRLEWLSGVGVRKVNLSGGEPTIRHDLPNIVDIVHGLGLDCAMTTNGIRLSARLMPSLQAARSKVKVSLHGPPDIHDEMLGIRCFENVDRTITRLQEAGVAVAIQAVLTKEHPDVWEWVIAHCVERGIRKVRFVPFVPRGRGALSADGYQMSLSQRDGVTRQIIARRHELADRIDIDVLDFWTQEYFVMETNGELQIQRETDAADSTFSRLPGAIDGLSDQVALRRRG